MYLDYFIFPTIDQEHDFFMSIKHKCYDTFYPFQVLSDRGLFRLDFAPITILYGGNGSGKSTALNVIAEKVGASRDSAFNKSNFYPNYVHLCQTPATANIPRGSRIITSDDVFDYMLNIRSLNEGIDLKRDKLFDEYMDAKFMGGEYAGFQFKSMADYDQLAVMVKARGKTQSRYVRSELMNNIREFSNGESAFKYFAEKIGENALYILDEPENSLSPARQMELAGFIADSARFYGCQFIISTHSPFLLAIKGARVYDLDQNPAAVRPWTALENVRVYYDFFKKHGEQF